MTYWCCSADFGEHEPACKNYVAPEKAAQPLDADQLKSCLWFFADGQLNFAVTLDRLNNFLRQRSLAGVEPQPAQQCEFVGLFQGRCIKFAGHEGDHLNGELMTGVRPDVPIAGAEPSQTVYQRTLAAAAKFIDANPYQVTGQMLLDALGGGEPQQDELATQLDTARMIRVWWEEGAGEKLDDYIAELEAREPGASERA